MQEQIISFDTAKLAKEKGFVFGIVKGLSYAYDYKKLVHERDNEYNVYHRDYKDRFTPAPTQSLLQKWLRELYDIHLYVEVSTDENDINEYEYTLTSDLLEEESDDGMCYKTYEQALEVGLQEALKLIK